MVTLDDIQSRIASGVDYTSSAPSTSDTEYARRLKLINKYEKQWALKEGYRWKDLVVSTTLTTTANVATVSLPTDYKSAILQPAGTLKVGSANYEFIPIYMKGKYFDNSQYLYITGNDAVGYTLNINPTPDDAYSIEFDYYSKYLATNSGGTDKEVMTTGTDITKCPDPEYIVYMVQYDLLMHDNRGDKAIECKNEGLNILDNLVNENFRNEHNYVRKIPVYKEDSGYLLMGD